MFALPIEFGDSSGGLLFVLLFLDSMYMKDDSSTISQMGKKTGFVKISSFHRD